MAFLSLGLRALVNVEAMNMVESVGNIVRHRKAAVIFRRDSSYIVRWVPAVSGECLAHSYQSWLADLATKRGLPVCEYCAKHEFVKHADLKIFGSLPWEQRLAELVKSVESGRGSKRSVDTVAFMHEFEKTIVGNCVVEDIGGFLYAGRIPVKRTSRFASSYMIPALDVIEKAVIETQFQVRHAPTASQSWEQAQMTYNVEVGSAVYAWSFYLDLASIGCCTAVKRECLDLEQRRKRVELAIDALMLMLENRLFGAKQSRYTPVVDYEIVLTSLSQPLPFNVSPPAMGIEFVEDTARRAQAFAKATRSEVELYAYTRNKDLAENLRELGIKTFTTITEMLSTVKQRALSMLR